MSKKMLALNVALLAVLLVSLPLQLRAYWPDAFANAFTQWVGCNTAWYDCDFQCRQTWGSGTPGYFQCRDASCDPTHYSCWGAINWPDFELDYCLNAGAAHTECLNERTSCNSMGSEGCDTVYWECRTSSGIDQCQ